MWQPRSVTPRTGAVAGLILVGLFLVIAGLIFFGVYLAVTGPDHFLALLTIGFLSLVFGTLAYFAQALSRQPTAQRALAFGFGAFGFGVLFLTTLALPWLYPDDALISLGAEVVLLIFLMILLIGPVIGMALGARNREVDQHRAEARSEWASHPPPSAFSYASGPAPTAPAPPAENPGPPMGGG
ncbi:MAG TPA: hypothetical protein VIZ68_01690 [Thermoplasmata archaeon]